MSLSFQMIYLACDQPITTCTRVFHLWRLQEPHQGKGGPGSIFCPYFIGSHRSRRWWIFYCLQRNYAEPRSGLSWYPAGVPHFRASTIFLGNILKYVTKKEYSASCARQFPANEYSSFQETHKRLRKRGLRPRPSYDMVVSHKRINLTLVFRSRMTVASCSARLQVQRLIRDNRGIL